VPVVLRRNEDLDLNLAEYAGSVTFTELQAVAAFLTENPAFLKSDTLSLVLPDAHFSGIDLAALDQLFGRYTTLYAPMSFQIVRRSAWICQSQAAQAHVDYWVGGRDALEAMSSTIRQFATFEQAGDWLVLSPAETAILERGDGFVECARFEDAAPTLRAAAR
jgi:hypothetical protein